MDNFKNQNNQQNPNVQQNVQPNFGNQSQNKGIFSLPPAVMNFVPWIPLMLEMTTGQKVPQITGTIGEIHQGIQNIQMALGQIIQNQQNLDQRLIALETNASNQFTNLAQQVQSIKSIRLTHDRKQIEVNPSYEEN